MRAYAFAMNHRRLLSSVEIDQRLPELPVWTLHEGRRLRRTFEFPDFVHAFGWMTKVALVAERMNHHPRWTNVYRSVEVELWTHDVEGLSPLDFELAAAMDRLATH